MAEKKPTHSDVAAKLIVEGCLANIAGNGAGQFPPGGVFLDEADRANLGLPQGGRTMFYAVDDTGVYANFQGAATTIWFQNDQSGDALAAVEKALKKAYPKAKQQEDKPMAKDKWSRQRSFDVPLTKDRAAVVDIGYPSPGAAAVGFMARVVAFGRADKKKKA